MAVTPLLTDGLDAPKNGRKARVKVQLSSRCKLRLAGLLAFNYLKETKLWQGLLFCRVVTESPTNTPLMAALL